MSKRGRACKIERHKRPKRREPAPLPYIGHDEWRHRLRAAIERTGKKHSYIARKAGIDPATLSRVLNGYHPRVGFDLVVSVTYAAGETVGWLLKEHGYTFSADERAKLRDAAATIIQVTT